MAVCILHDRQQDQAVLYCTTTDWAFGPVFAADAEGDHDAEERAEAFLRWLGKAPRWFDYERDGLAVAGRRDPRQLTERGLERAVYDWRAQEAEQWKAEADAEAALLAEE